jgi:hypothetical protein
MATGANTTINLNAVDNTRAAFLGVQRSLQQVERRSAMVSRSILQTGLGIVGGSGLAMMLSREIRNVITNIESIPGVPDNVAASVLALKNRFEQVKTTAQGAIASSIGWFAQLSQDLGIAYGALVYGFAAATDAYDQMNAAQQDALDAARVKSFETIQRQIEDELTAGRRLLMSRKEIRDEYMAEVEAASERATAHRAEGREMEALIATLEAYRASNAATREELAMQREEALALARAENERTRGAREAAKILSEGFEDAVFSGKKLSEVVKQLGLDLMRLMFRRMITNPLANFFEGGFTKILGFANGGRPPVGRPSIVGERGPELFIPSTAGTIIPNHQLGGGSGGSTYYIDARGADQTGLARLEAMIRQTQAAIVPMALGAVQDARARGGAFAM